MQLREAGQHLYFDNSTCPQYYHPQFKAAFIIGRHSARPPCTGLEVRGITLRVGIHFYKMVHAV